MPATVPTWDDFAALEMRVSALEDAEPPVAGGTQAKRVMALFPFGTNTFSSLDEHNVWGSWPADYRPAPVIAALRWIVGDTGHTIAVREYHYASRTDMQREWLTAVHAAFPDQRNAICPGANASTADVPTMLDLQRDVACGIEYVEGLNEPNTDFGGGTVPVETTMAIQRMCDDTDAWQVMGASVVAGMPHPEGWITGYFGDQIDEHNALIGFGNGHFYPPHCPDLPGDDCSVVAYVSGLSAVYEASIAVTEFHPTLYNAEGHKPDQAGWSGTLDTYYTLLTLFRCARLEVPLWWYALLDYGSTYRCGLYPTNADDPREVAYALRALCAICADPGEERLTFAPGRLEYTVAGADASVSHDLYQASDGTFFVVLWRSMPEPGGEPLAVTLEFPSLPTRRIEEYDIGRLAAERVTENYEPLQVSEAGFIISMLDGSARVLIA
jgi:hypothetical protein